MDAIDTYIQQIEQDGYCRIPGVYTPEQMHKTLDLTKDAYDGRQDRPWAEFHIRAIPNTAGKYVAVAGTHHGSTPGLLVTIDTSIPDDNRMSQVRLIRGAELSQCTSGCTRCPRTSYERLSTRTRT